MASIVEIIAALFTKKKPSNSFVIPKKEEPVAVKPTPKEEPKKVETLTPTPQSPQTVVASKKFTPQGKTRSSATARYGAVTSEAGKLVWKDEAKWMTMFVPPAGFEHWVNTASNRPVAKIYCNKDMHAPLKQALENLKERGLAKELKTFDGCFMLRMVRGSTDSVSTHSYGLALDVNAAENGLGKEPKLSAEFVKCWTDAGFSWGGNFSRKDGMHFSFAWE